ncbi:MAG: hypothetical protein MZU91_11195 [Desulfosudis oleivorans]|nr:hypothetical protein [Desulfosudis oleivorans]
MSPPPRARQASPSPISGSSTASGASSLRPGRPGRGASKSPLLVPDARGPMRGVRRDRPQDGQPRPSGRRLGPLRDLPRRALRPERARGPHGGPVDRRRARADGVGRRGLLRRPAEDRRWAGSPGGDRARLPAARPAPRHPLRRRRQRLKLASELMAPPRERRSTSSTSPRRGSIPPTSTACSGFSPGSSRRDIRSWRSNTTSISSRGPDTSSTWDRKAATREGRSSSRERRRLSRTARRRTPAPLSGVPPVGLESVSARVQAVRKWHGTCGMWMKTQGSPGVIGSSTRELRKATLHRAPGRST